MKDNIKRRHKPEAKREIWHPVLYTDADIRAIQALAVYAALPDEQKSKQLAPAPSDVKRALDWIIINACQRDENPTAATLGRPDGDRMAAFVDGRKSVADQIVKLMKLKPESFKNGHEGNPG